MSTREIWVCEQEGRWAARLGRRLSETGVRVRQARSLEEMRSGWAVDDGRLYAVQANSVWLRKLVDFITEMRARFPSSQAIILGDNADPEMEWLVREAGAIEWVTSVQQLLRLQQLVERQFARLSHRETTLRELIWERLPWPDAVAIRIAETPPAA